MGLQNQLSDVSSESFIILTVVLIGKSVRYLRSFLSTILRAAGVFSARSDADRPYSGSSLYDAVGSGLAGVIILCEQLNLNRVCSYKNRSGDGGSDCTVCLDRLADGDAVRKLACRHVFHKDCLDGWLGQLSFSCPLCRAPLASDERVECTRRRVAGDVLAWFPFQ